MRHLMLLVGMGTALVAANACRPVPPTPLSAAAAANDVEAIRRLLADGHPPDGPQPGGWTPLMWAARAGAVDAMRLLIDAGANANAVDDRNHWTPLLHAVHRQQPDAVRVLLEHGAHPNDVQRNGQVTPLMMAAADRDPAIVELLLRHGADPRYQSESGDTALTIAVSGGALFDLLDRPPLGGCRPATVHALLAHDPALRLPDNAAGARALWWARFHRCDQVLAEVERT